MLNFPFERNVKCTPALKRWRAANVAIGRALMSRPKLLLMDEPSMDWPHAGTADFETVTEINKSGTTILLVEQNARWP